MVNKSIVVKDKAVRFLVFLDVKILLLFSIQLSVNEYLLFVLFFAFLRMFGLWLMPILLFAYDIFKYAERPNSSKINEKVEQRDNG